MPGLSIEKGTLLSGFGLISMNVKDIILSFIREDLAKFNPTLLDDSNMYAGRSIHRQMQRDFVGTEYTIGGETIKTPGGDGFSGSRQVLALMERPDLAWLKHAMPELSLFFHQGMIAAIMIAQNQAAGKDGGWHLASGELLKIDMLSFAPIPSPELPGCQFIIQADRRVVVQLSGKASLVATQDYGLLVLDPDKSFFNARFTYHVTKSAGEPLFVVPMIPSRQDKYCFEFHVTDLIG
ncbi:hypothetical protein [Endozoicomonas euniceicola]|uniref:Uncharacterized protein n=1 Tax=Endozoicomonas euniceicola TaxID=1234143 RepID=A0ABY6GZZ6_9GAMM|nr:hypothetical protein [Endozoicomonas euniceicola]UYM18255.1 hypothetical protein NX720_10230 [Endozoicomonas euniceicola]